MSNPDKLQHAILVDIGNSSTKQLNCENIFNVDQEDTDLDRVGDVCDNCPFFLNPAQLNNDGDFAGDLCDTDDDNDGVGMFSNMH